jgi:hypothetical protein
VRFRRASLGLSVALGIVASASLVSMCVLAIAHIRDRQGIGAASGALMGLAASARHGVWYPPVLSHGFYGGTRYMPVPIVLGAAGSVVSNEYLVSAKLEVLAVSAALFALMYAVARRRGAPRLVALGVVGAVVASASASTTVLGIRWDALAALLQLAAVAIVAELATPRRAAFAGALCAIAFATKTSALWGPAVVLIWLVRAHRRYAAIFAASFVVSVLAIGIPFQLLSDGRLTAQLRSFTFAGSGFSSRLEGVHRIYQLALRDQRELPLLLLLAGIGVLLAGWKRRLGPYELALVLAAAILVVVMRDLGAYENHLIDVEVLSGVVVAGMWPARREDRRALLVGSGIACALIVATVVAARRTLLPPLQRTVSHELRGRADPRLSTHPFGTRPAGRGCGLFEDASIPILASERPTVLDAFIVHRLQVVRRAALEQLARRVERRDFSRIVLTRPLSDRGWFATLDFGTRIADAARANYRLSTTVDGFFVYTPKGGAASAAACHPTRLD